MAKLRKRTSHITHEEVAQFLRLERLMAQAVKRIDFDADGTISILFSDDETESYRDIPEAASAISWWFNVLVDKHQIERSD